MSDDDDPPSRLSVARDGPVEGARADPWAALARLTPARIALGRSGASLPTRQVLTFGLAHAQARDAVHLPTEIEALTAQVAALGWEPVQVASRATTREDYLRRPDLGRRLDEESCDALRARPAAAFDLAIVIGDGLSATALHANLQPFLAVLKPHLDAAPYRLAPVALALNARVALADEIAEILGARAAIMLIGERPGLSSPDSLGAYLTFGPRVGRSDAERNCISNIRRAGLGYDQAAFKLAWLLREALQLGRSGVTLKDQSDASWLARRQAGAALGTTAPGGS